MATGSRSQTFTLDCDFDRFRQIMVRKNATAAMHPWEDFAETVNVYLDIMAIADTANAQGMTSINVSASASADEIVRLVLEIAVNVSEFNLDFGLMPLLPEKFSPKVLEKLK